MCQFYMYRSGRYCYNTDKKGFDYCAYHLRKTDQLMTQSDALCCGYYLRERIDCGHLQPCLIHTSGKERKRNTIYCRKCEEPEDTIIPIPNKFVCRRIMNK